MNSKNVEKIIKRAHFESSQRPVILWNKLKKKLSYLNDNNYTARIVFDWLVRTEPNICA